MMYRNKINAVCTENYPYVTPDGNYLIFNYYNEVSNAGDIYWIHFSEILNLKKHIEQ